MTSREFSPLLIAAIASIMLGFITSLLILLTPVIHAGVPLAIFTAGMVLALLVGGAILERR